MADKQISQLPEASSVTITDLFVLEQSGAAKKLTGSTLQAWLLAMADGHGGIADIAYTSPVAPSRDGTLTITLADGTTDSFTITNGADGTNGTDGTNGATFTPSVDASGNISWTNDGGLPNPQTVNIKGATGDDGESSYAYIKWASEEPTSDADMSDVPDEWMGIYVGTSSTAPTHYTSYTWYKVKGETGAAGDDGEPITAVERTGGDGSPGTDDTYTCYVGDTAVGTFIVHNGVDGIGTVNSINGIGVDAGTNNITLTAANVNAPTVPIYIWEASFSSLPHTISDPRIKSNMRVIDCVWGNPNAIKSDISWNTETEGQLVLSGTMSGSTTANIILIETTY